jgi:hypothetical protein
VTNIGSYEYVDHDYDARASSPLRASALARQRVQAMRMPTPDDGRTSPAIPPGIMPAHVSQLPRPNRPVDPLRYYQPPDPARVFQPLGPIMAIGAGPDGLGHEPPPPEPPPGPGPALVSGSLSLPVIVGGVLALSVLAGLFAPKIVGFKPNRRRRRR